jgi:hypothetical protein
LNIDRWIGLMMKNSISWINPQFHKNLKN